MPIRLDGIPSLMGFSAITRIRATRFLWKYVFILAKIVGIMCNIIVDKAGKMCQPVSTPKMMFSMERSAIRALKVCKVSEDRNPCCRKAHGRAREFEEAIEWLVSAGMLNRLYNVTKTEHPLSAFDRLDCFKLFVFDTGLLKHMAGIDNSAILLKTDYQFKGPLTENYVLQQLRGQFEVEPRYYEDKIGEIDFVLQNGTEIIPVEVKGGEDKSAPSFKRYIADCQPKRAIRFSRRGYLKNGMITNIPLYLAKKTKDLL